MCKTLSCSILLQIHICVLKLNNSDFCKFYIKYWGDKLSVIEDVNINIFFNDY